MPNIEKIIQHSKDVVWSLRKKDLHTYFLVLQQYALNPHPLNISSSILTTHTAPSAPIDLPPLLPLPLEIRRQIYTHLLEPSTYPPIRGPHYRCTLAHTVLPALPPPKPPNPSRSASPPLRVPHANRIHKNRLQHLDPQNATFQPHSIPSTHLVNKTYPSQHTLTLRKEGQ